MAVERDVRPWGFFEVLVEEPGYKVKRIEVKPGQRLSLQSHEKRSEHWVVVAGEAVVTVGDGENVVRINEHVAIPVGCKHRIANRGSGPLVFIEVQCGSYLGEDDIKRYQDDYHRSQ
jgi:mannose-6-phosphate isomerase